MSPRDAEDLERLRELLFGRERARLDRLDARSDDPEARRRHVRDGWMDLLASEPAAATDPLVPLVLPLLRHALMAQLRAYLRSLEALVEQTLTLRSLRWRWTAWRTGRSVGEVALRDIELNRVERLILVHRDTGLALAQVGSEAEQDPDVVASLVTAVGAFAKDAFEREAEPGGELERMEMGDRELWILRGRWLLLVAEVRGIGTIRLRTRLSGALATIEGQLSAALADYEGDEDLSPVLAPRLVEHLAGETRPPARWTRWVLASLGVVLLFALVGLFSRARSQRAPLETWVERLEAHPGVVVLSRRFVDGAFEVEGLRDPQAPPLPAPPPGVATRERWRGYVSLEPEVAIRRARRALAPPPTVDVDLVEGTLVLTGTASERWRRRAVVRAPVVVGVASVDATGVRDPRRIALERARRALEGWRARFAVGAAVPEAADLETLGERARAADRLAGALGLRLALTIRGGADARGTEATNRRLARARAAWLERQLRAISLEHASIVDVLGARQAGREARIHVRLSREESAEP